MRNRKNITNPKVGMRIKVRLPAGWCQIPSDSPYHWMKGKIIKVLDDEKVIVASIWSKKCGRIDGMMCFKNNKKGYFDNIVKQL